MPKENKEIVKNCNVPTQNISIIVVENEDLLLNNLLIGSKKFHFQNTITNSDGNIDTNNSSDDTNDVPSSSNKL